MRLAIKGSLSLYIYMIFFIHGNIFMLLCIIKNYYSFLKEQNGKSIFIWVTLVKGL